MHISHRLLSAVRFALHSVTVVFCLGWICLYVGSVYQRYRAERLISDLSRFPFTTADFRDVRDFVTQHGGSPILQFPLTYSAPNLPWADGNGHVQMPTMRTGPTCTPQDCTFQLSITSPLFGVWWNGRFGRLFSLLALVGLRPWIASAVLEVREGKLWACDAGVGQGSFPEVNSHVTLLPLGYGVQYISVAKADAVGVPTRDYVVGFFPRISGLVGRVFSTRLVQPSQTSVQRAFDIHPDCTTAILRSCDLSQLAPSAWAEYQRDHQAHN
jgi:hypothetical protein